MIYLIFLLAAFVEASVFPAISQKGIVPSLVLVVLILWLRKNSGGSSGWRAVIIGGLLLDFFSGEILGVNILALMIVFLFIKWAIAKTIKSDNIIIIFSAILFLSIYIFDVTRLLAVSSIILKKDFSTIFEVIKYYSITVFLWKSILSIILLNILIWLNRRRQYRSYFIK